MKSYSLVIPEKQSFEFSEERIIIGRAPVDVAEQFQEDKSSHEIARFTKDRLYLFSNDVEFDHAILRRDHDDRISIENHRSRAEIYVNGELIDARTTLEVGDKLSIGPYEFILHLENTAPTDDLWTEGEEEENSYIPCRWCGGAVAFSENKCPHCGDLAPFSPEQFSLNCETLQDRNEEGEQFQHALEEIANRHQSLKDSKLKERFCPHCSEWGLAIEEEPQTRVHGLIALLLFTPWVFIWLVLKLFPTCRCTQCGGATSATEAFPFRWLNGRRIVLGSLGLLILIPMTTSVFQDGQKRQVAALFREGAKSMEEEDYELAQEKFNRIIELEPDSPEAFYNRGLTNVRLQNDEEAIADFSRAIDKHNKHTEDSLKADALHQRAHCFERLGQTEAALTGFTQSIDLEHDRVEFWKCRAKFHSRQSMIDEAINDLCEVARIEPNEESHLNTVGYLFYTNERYEEAIDFYTEMIESSRSHPVAYFHRASAKMSLHQHQSAIPDLEEYLDSDPDNYSALKALGRCHLILDSQTKALDRLDAAIEQYAEDPDAYYLRAIAHFNLRHQDQALEDIEKAMSLIDESSEEYSEYFELREEIQELEVVPLKANPVNVL